MSNKSHSSDPCRYSTAYATGRELAAARFLSFCVEQFKHRHGGDGLSVGQTFSRNGIFRFLTDNFEVEHCLGAEQILDDVDAILRRKGVLA